MASLSIGADGLSKVYFKGAGGKRQCLYLGRIPKKTAEGIQRAVSELERSAMFGHTPADFALAWLTTVGDDVHAKLVLHGLARPKVVVAAAPSVTIEVLIERFKDRPRWRRRKPATHYGYNFAFRHMLAFFGSHRGVESVTETDAEDLLEYLKEDKPKGAGLAAASANRMVDSASMLFRFARKSRLIPANPFDDVKRGVLATSRKAFIEPATATLVIDAMKDSQWRLLVALSRWGGLRVPSEPKLLRWGDIDWERDRFTVHSPKTEHHPGGESRVVPIFPELRPYLEERFEEAEEGDEFVLPMMQGYGPTAYRHQLERTVRKLGLEVWPRIYHNLRASRQTELRQQYPGYVSCSWLGNTERIADKHYHQVLDSHFEQALQKPLQQVPAPPRETPLGGQPKGSTQGGS